MPILDPKTKLIEEQHQEVLRMSKRHGRELEKLMCEQATQIEALSIKHAKQMAELDAGGNPRTIDDGISQALEYEIYLVCSAILAKFNAARELDPSVKWFGLQQAFDAEAANTDIGTLLAQHGKSWTSAYKSAASFLRNNGAYISGRMYIAGKVQRAVWLDPTDQQAFFLRRKQIIDTPQLRGELKNYDLSHQWEQKA